MSPSTQARRLKLKELRERHLSCDDPYYLLAEYAYELERVKNQLKRQEEICICD